MKKLFETGSSVTIEEFSTLRINGPYALLKLGPDFAIIRYGEHLIEVSGDELTVEALAEEVAVFSFDSITSMNVTTNTKKDTYYG